MSRYKFSGHETFQCRHFWLKKGYDFVRGEGDFKSNQALIDLGVGKNMITSISYWLKAFKVINESGELSNFGQKMFDDSGFDPYLEDIGTQYLLHFNLIQNSAFASIYKMAFEDFRRTRIDAEFTEGHLADFVIKVLIREGESISEKSVQNDVKVFLKTYYSGSKRGAKSIEDDFASVLIGLGFIDRVEGVLVDGSPLFRINVSEQKELDSLLFLYMIVDVFEGYESISVDQVQAEISDKVLCNREGTDEKLNQLMNGGFLVYKQDAGRKEIQFKGSIDKLNLLSKYYGRV
jgi:hypothetical protein